MKEYSIPTIKAIGRSHNLSPSDILVLPFDMTDFSAHRAALDEVVEHFGAAPDVMVQNAGISQRAKWENIDLDVRYCNHINTEELLLLYLNCHRLTVPCSILSM